MAMKINYFCPRWGSEDMEWNVFLQKVIDEGYDGVEISLPTEEAERNQILELLSKYNLPFIVQHWETITPDLQAHKEEYHQRLEMLVSAKPLFVNAQTGKDFFSFEENKQLVELAAKVSKTSGIAIYHETHRGKFSFAAHIMKFYLEKIPTMKITLDLSHWCNVAESFLADQKAAVDLAIEHTHHIHARVGFPEGPQVPDPRTPENQEALEKHLGWWQQVINTRKKEGVTTFTITPEFGPYPYMTAMPFTQLPISNQWEINAFMKDYLKDKLLT